jgi:cytoskeletal protein RodZ
MMDWLNRGEHEKQRRKRRWQFLGFLLIGVAVGVYWFDRRTSNTFDHESNLNQRQPSQAPGSQSESSADQTASTAGASTAANAGEAHESYRTPAGGAATSTAHSPGFGDDIPEPKTDEEEETILKGETGQLAASRQSSSTFNSDKTQSSQDGGGPTESAEKLAETGPVPTITSGLVEGNGTHDCPDGFPIKGNASSRIYHLPGESTYEVTIPEVCFATDEDAAAAGYRPRKH